MIVLLILRNREVRETEETVLLFAHRDRAVGVVCPLATIRTFHKLDVTHDQRTATT